MHAFSKPIQLLWHALSRAYNVRCVLVKMDCALNAQTGQYDCYWAQQLIVHVDILCETAEAASRASSSCPYICTTCLYWTVLAANKQVGSKREGRRGGLPPCRCLHLSTIWQNKKLRQTQDVQGQHRPKLKRANACVRQDCKQMYLAVEQCTCRIWCRLASHFERILRAYA